MVAGATDPGREAGNRTRGARAAPSCQVISRRIAQCSGGGATRVRLDPANGNVMMGTDLLQKATDVLNDVLIAARLVDGVVPEGAHAVIAISDQVEASANGHGGGPVRDTNPLEGMIESADFTGVVGWTEGQAKYIEAVETSLGADPIILRALQRKNRPYSPRPIKELRVFYGVRLGHVLGVYTFWKEAQPHTIDIRSDFKRFKTRQKAP